MKIYKKRVNILPLGTKEYYLRKYSINDLYKDCRKNIFGKFKFVPIFKKGKTPQQILSMTHWSPNLKNQYLFVVFRSMNVSGVKFIIHAYNIDHVPLFITKIWPMKKMIKILHKYTKPIYIRTIPV